MYNITSRNLRHFTCKYCAPVKHNERSIFIQRERACGDAGFSCIRLPVVLPVVLDFVIVITLAWFIIMFGAGPEILSFMFVSLFAGPSPSFATSVAWNGTILNGCTWPMQHMTR